MAWYQKLWSLRYWRLQIGLAYHAYHPPQPFDASRLRTVLVPWERGKSHRAMFKQNLVCSRQPVVSKLCDSLWVQVLGMVDTVDWVDGLRRYILNIWWTAMPSECPMDSWNTNCRGTARLFAVLVCGTKGNPCPVVGINTQDSRPYFQRVEKQENCLRDDST